MPCLLGDSCLSLCVQYERKFVQLLNFPLEMMPKTMQILVAVSTVWFLKWPDM